MIVTSGCLALVGRMDLSVPGVAGKSTGEFPHEAYINVQAAIIKFLLQRGRFFIRPGLH